MHHDKFLWSSRQKRNLLQLLPLSLETNHRFHGKEKPYLNPKFSTQELSRMLDIPLHQCSYLINFVIGKSFMEWINEYRIDHFIQEYTTIQTIFHESEFKNKNTFYTSFKKRWVFCRLNILQKNNGPHRLITNIIY